jgi:hypothetical protein
MVPRAASRTGVSSANRAGRGAFSSSSASVAPRPPHACRHVTRKESHRDEESRIQFLAALCAARASTPHGHRSSTDRRLLLWLEDTHQHYRLRRSAGDSCGPRYGDVMSVFNGVKVFAATMVAQRQELGDVVTRWLEEARRTRPGFELVDMKISQSSDAAFHCISIVLFFREWTTTKGARTGAVVGTSSKESTPTSVRTATSSAGNVEYSQTSASTRAPKKNR